VRVAAPLTQVAVVLREHDLPSNRSKPCTRVYVWQLHCSRAGPVNLHLVVPLAVFIHVGAPALALLRARCPLPHKVLLLVAMPRIALTSRDPPVWIWTVAICMSGCTPGTGMPAIAAGAAGATAGGWQLAARGRNLGGTRLGSSQVTTQPLGSQLCGTARNETSGDHGWHHGHPSCDTAVHILFNGCRDFCRGE
jgi:hypothetical protein